MIQKESTYTVEGWAYLLDLLLLMTLSCFSLKKRLFGTNATNMEAKVLLNKEIIPEVLDSPFWRQLISKSFGKSELFFALLTITFGGFITVLITMLSF